MEFLLPHDNSSKERTSHSNPPLNPLPLPQPKKIPLETYVHFPIPITVCKHRSKFVTCSPSPGDCGGASHPQRHIYYVYRLCCTKWTTENFDELTLGKK